MEIILAGKTVIVDDEDVASITKHTWCNASSKPNAKAGRWYFKTHWLYERGTERRTHSMLHRFIMGIPPRDKRIVDHKNGNTLDNRKSNLRVCTRTENNQNSTKKCFNTSGYKGVSKHKNKYVAQITYGGLNHYLGLFRTKEEAYAAYCAAALKYHGEFAKLE